MSSNLEVLRRKYTNSSASNDKPKQKRQTTKKRAHGVTLLEDPSDGLPPLSRKRTKRERLDAWALQGLIGENDEEEDEEAQDELAALTATVDDPVLLQEYLQSRKTSAGGNTNAESEDKKEAGKWVEIDVSGDQEKKDADLSPLRRRSADLSPPRRRAEDLSPPRRRAEDLSPPRRRAEGSSPSSGSRVRNTTHSENGAAGGGGVVDADGDLCIPRRRQLSDSNGGLSTSRSRNLYDDELRRRQRKQDDSDLFLPRRRTRERVSMDGDASQERMSGGTPADISNFSSSVSRELQPSSASAADVNRSGPHVSNDPLQRDSGGGNTGGDDIVGTRDNDLGSSMRRPAVVYRDRSGRVITEEEWNNTVGNRHSKRQLREKKKKEPPQELEWGKGLVQKQQKDDRLAEEARIMAAPFTRYEIDQSYDEELRAREHWNDPLQKFAELQQLQRQPTAAAPAAAESSRPVARPKCRFAAPPNRFGILPGVRWDGAIRGVGFEDRLLSSRNRAALDREIAQKWSVEDM